jgi:hypothetical protein
VSLLILLLDTLHFPCNFSSPHLKSSNLQVSTPQVQVSQSQSHIATDSQSIGLSWCRAPSGAHDQIFAYLFNLLEDTVLSMGAPSLTRGRVCRLSVSPSKRFAVSVINLRHRPRTENTALLLLRDVTVGLPRDLRALIFVSVISIQALWLLPSTDHIENLFCTLLTTKLPSNGL